MAVCTGLTQLYDVARIMTLPFTNSSTKFILSIFSVYPHVLVKNVVTPMSAIGGNRAYIELLWVGKEKGFYIL